MDNGADIIAFAGGDGTARDILDITKGEITVIGIPTGVKMQSAVFSITPNQAGSLLDAFISGKINGIKQLEVMDLNEADYINNKISSTLYGYLPVPYDKKGSHAKKSASPLTDEAGKRRIALDVIDTMNEKLYYLIGPGSTTKAIADELKEEST